MDELFFSMLTFIYHFTPLVVGVADLVLAIIIFKAKTKTRVFGVVVTAAFLSSILEFLKQAILPRMLTVEMYSRCVAISNIAEFVMNLASLLAVCIYIHKVYGKKWIYIPVFILYLGGRVLLSLVTMLVNKAGVDIIVTILVTQFGTFLVSGSIEALLIVAFFNHRHEEKVIPHLWIIRLSMLALTLVSCVLAAINQIVLRGTGPRNYDALEVINAITMIWYSIVSLAGLIAPIYIVIRNSKFKREVVKAGIE